MRGKQWGELIHIICIWAMNSSSEKSYWFPTGGWWKDLESLLWAPEEERLNIICGCCSLTNSCPVLCDLIDYSTPGSSALHYFLEFAQTHVYWVSDAIQPSRLLLPPSPAFNLSQHQNLFTMSRLFASGDQSTGASASASVLPMSIQGQFPLRWTGLISLLSQDSQESSPASQSESINSSVFSLL